MKLKATRQLIFTFASLRNQKFNDCVLLEKNSFFGKYVEGKICEESAEKVDEIKIEFKKLATNKYIYHIKRISGGLEYEHLCYAKANWRQHFLLTFNNRLKELTAEQWLAISTIILTFSTLMLALFTYWHHEDFEEIIKLLKK